MDGMIGNEWAQTVMLGAFLIIGYYMAYYKISGRLNNSSVRIVAAVILLFFFGSFSACIWVIYQTFGTIGFLLYGCIFFMAVWMFFSFFKTLIQNFDEIRKDILALFLIYLLSVLYITLFSRMGTSQSYIQMELFFAIRKAILLGTVDVMKHMMLNIALFVPLGATFPMIYPEKFSSAFYTIVAGAGLSCIIETIQLLSHMGQCDVDDLVANILGMGLGFSIYWFFLRRFQEVMENDG